MYKSLIVRAIGSVAQLLLNLVIGRVYGAAITGLFNVFANWALFFSAFYSLGLHPATLRKFAIAERQSSDRFSVAKSNHQFIINALISCTISFCLGTFLLYIFIDISLNESLLWASVAGGILGILRILSEAIKGIGKINSSFIGEFLLIPLVIVVFVGIFKISNAQFVEYILYIFYVISAIISTVIMAWILFNVVAFNADKSIAIRGQEMVNFWLIGLLNTVFAVMPYFVLSYASAPADDVGLFAIAHKLIAVLGTVVAAIGGIFASRFAKLSFEEDISRLRVEFLNARRITFVLCAPYVAVLVMFGEEILGLFGNEFVNGLLILLILLTGRMFSSIFGQTEVFLNVIGLSTIELVSAIISIFIFTLLVSLLHEYQANGVAIAYSSAIFIRSFVSYIYISNFVFAKKGMS